jgi:hypothetical protein
MTILMWATAVALMAALRLGVASDVVTLAWNPSPDAGIARYRIYFGTNAGLYSFVTNAGLALTQTVVLPQRGRWFFVATACDTNGVESRFSNEVEWEIKPDPPMIRSELLVRVTPVLERSTNLVSWSMVRGEPTLFAATNAAEFFRASHLTIEPVHQAK